MATTQIEQPGVYDWLTELERPDVQESLTYLLQMLPDIQKSVESIDTMVQFGQSVVKDRKTVQSLEDRISLMPINEDTLDAFVKLAGKLPVLLELVEQLEQISEFVKNVWNDKKSLEQINASLEDLPVVNQIRGVLETAEEIKQKAETEPIQHVSIFTVMKWMKSPSVQKGLHYIKATLDVLDKK